MHTISFSSENRDEYFPPKLVVRFTIFSESLPASEQITVTSKHPVVKKQHLVINRSKKIPNSFVIVNFVPKEDFYGIFAVLFLEFLHEAHYLLGFDFVEALVAKKGGSIGEEVGVCLVTLRGLKLGCE